MIKNTGRKMMILIALPVAFTMLLILSYSMYEANDDNAAETAAETEALKHTERIVFIAASTLYILSVSIVFSSTVWGVASEIFPIYLLSTASSFSASFGWAVNFVITSIFLNILDDPVGRWIIFIILAALTGCAFIFVLFCVPETIGKSVMQNLTDMLGDYWVKQQRRKLKKDGIRMDYANVTSEDKIGKDIKKQRDKLGMVVTF
jgi:MFS family permease